MQFCLKYQVSEFLQKNRKRLIEGGGQETMNLITLALTRHKEPDLLLIDLSTQLRRLWLVLNDRRRCRVQIMED